MSNSYKYSIWKQHNDKFYKKLSNKLIRRFLIKLEKGFKNTKLFKQVVNKYDICDYKWIPRNKEDLIKAKRK